MQTAAGGARFRGGRPDPRPHPRADAGPGAPGHQRRGHRRRRRDRRASGGRPDLRPGVLFPRRPELGQPRLFPEPRPPASGRGGAGRLHRPVLRQPAEAAAGAAEPRLGRARAGRRGAVARAAAQVELAVPQRGDKRKLVEPRSSTRARRSAAGSPRAPRSAGCSKASPRPSASRPPPDRIEVYDNSHIQGSNAVGAMIVAGPEGFIEKRLPQVQHPRATRLDRPDAEALAGDGESRRHAERASRRRRLRDDARGAAAPLCPRAQGGSRARAAAAGPTWC